jgi:hypothetical protein
VDRSDGNAVLQTYITDFFRELARRDGWYRHRRSVQVVFIAGDAMAALAVGAYLLRLALAAGSGVRFAMIGLVLVGAYILLRAASFHHVDSALGRTVNGVKVHNYVELGCILVVAAGALSAMLRHSSRVDQMKYR